MLYYYWLFKVCFILVLTKILCLFESITFFLSFPYIYSADSDNWEYNFHYHDLLFWHQTFEEISYLHATCMAITGENHCLNLAAVPIKDWGKSVLQLHILLAPFHNWLSLVAEGSQAGWSSDSTNYKNYLINAAQDLSSESLPWGNLIGIHRYSCWPLVLPCLWVAALIWYLCGLANTENYLGY